MTSTLFWQITRLSILRQFSYKAATIAGLATNLFFGLLRAAVIIALFQARQEVEGYSLQDGITFTGVSQAVIAYLSFFGWYELMNTVYTGQIGADLLKPIKLYTFWLARDLGRAVVTLITRGVPVLVCYALVFDITTPTLPGQWLGLILVIALAGLVSFNFRFLVNLASFWTPNASGIARMAYSLSWIFSGFLMPLRFYPEWFIQFCFLTPFPHMVNSVVEVYLGVHGGERLLPTIAGQAFWALLLFFINQVVLKAGIKRLVIQGG